MEKNLVTVDVVETMLNENKEVLLSEILQVFTQELNKSGYEIICNENNDRVVVRK